MRDERLTFFVPGKPIPQGSMQAFVNKHTGRAVIASKNPPLHDWRMKVTGHAIDAQAEWMHTRPEYTFPLTGPIGMKIDFVLPRPSTHMLPINSRRAVPEVKPHAPLFPDQKPDLDKLVRAILDALTDAQVWHDDSQVAFITTAKLYPDTEHDREGVYITFGRMKVA